jgi:hypothetical protein
MKTLIYILLISLAGNTFAQKKDRAYLKDSLFNSRLVNCENKLMSNYGFITKLEILEERMVTEEKINEKSLEGISKQLDAANFNLTLFGILFGIAAILLGAYVTIIERKIVKINEENKELLSKNQKIKQEVENLNDLIQKDIYGLFIKIKKEETLHILDRLINVPKDIANVMKTLLVRELQQEDFQKLKIAFSKIGDSKMEREEYKGRYYLLFFQHFLNQSLRDETLRKGMLENIPHSIVCAFENDIIKSSKDFAIVIVDCGISNYKEEINKYFEGLSDSQHKDYVDVYKIIFEFMGSRNNRFDLFQIIESSAKTRRSKINYGNILLEAYANDELSESEKLCFEEINRLKKEEDEEGKKKKSD